MYKRKNKLKRSRMSRRMKSYNKRKNYASKVVVPGKGQIFPDRYFCKLRYTHVTSSSGAVNNYFQFAGNSCFDPYLGLGGGQPMGYDQLAQLYLTYRVHKSAIKVKAINQTTQPAYVTCYPIASTSPPGPLQNDLEQRYSKNKLLTSIAAGGVITLNHSISTKKLWGEAYLDDVFEAATGANPTKLWAWNVAMYSADGVSNQGINLAVEVTYYVEFKQPVRLSVS